MFFNYLFLLRGIERAETKQALFWILPKQSAGECRQCDQWEHWLCPGRRSFCGSKNNEEFPIGLQTTLKDGSNPSFLIIS